MAYRTPTDEPLLTEREYLDLPYDELRWSELVAGRVVREPPPSYRHGRIAARLARLMASYAETASLGDVLVEGGFRLVDDPPTIRGPNIAFVAADRIPPDDPVFFSGAPDLAVEIVSPSNSASEMRAKVSEYFDAGARLVWLVYPDMRTVAVHESKDVARYVEEPGVLDGGDVMPGLEVPVVEVFG